MKKPRVHCGNTKICGSQVTHPRGGGTGGWSSPWGHRQVPRPPSPGYGCLQRKRKVGGKKSAQSFSTFPLGWHNYGWWGGFCSSGDTLSLSQKGEWGSPTHNMCGRATEHPIIGRLLEISMATNVKSTILFWTFVNTATGVHSMRKFNRWQHNCYCWFAYIGGQQLQDSVSSVVFINHCG